LSRIIGEMIVMSWRTFASDIVFSINNFGPLWGKPGQKRIITIHDVWFMSEAYDGSWLTKKIFQCLITIQLLGTYKVVTVSEFSRQQIMRYFKVGKNRIEVINLPVPLASGDDRSSIKSDDHYLLLVGSDRPNKNISRAFQALDFLSGRDGLSKVPNVVVVGSYSDEFVQQMKDRHSKIWHKIDFRGYVVRGDYIGLLKSASGVLFPSLYEGFGFPAVEAACYSKPVLISRGTVCEENVGEVAISVDGNSVRSICDGILAIQRYNVDAAAPKFGSIKARFSDKTMCARQLASILNGCSAPSS